MRNTVFLLCLLFITACHRKSVPAKTQTQTATTIINPNKNKNVSPPPPNTITETKPDSLISIPPVAPVPAALIIVDGYGRVLTPSTKLPADSGIKADYTKLSRGFTPQQIANLKARYKMVPPRVLYVSEQYTLKSLRGTYCIYKKKFWYWKKEDGLFYLDEMYYK
jgi:hypothetical protein